MLGRNFHISAAFVFEMMASINQLHVRLEYETVCNIQKINNEIFLFSSQIK